MSKKGRKQQGQERETLYRVHYECVRRNPDYKTLYRGKDYPWGPELARGVLAGEWGICRGDELPNPEERPPLGEVLTRAIPDEVGLSRLSTDVLRDRRLQQAMNMVSFALTDAKSDRESVAGTLALAYIPDEDQHRPRVTVLDIRWSKKDLMETLESWVDVFLADRIGAGLKQDRPKRRFRVTEYEGYLRVYDLREEGGKTFREIAEMLWPDASGDLVKRARDYYKKGKALVLAPPLSRRRAVRGSRADATESRPSPEHGPKTRSK